MWVATNRQKPPEENAFAQRARRQREAAEAAASTETAAQLPAPTAVADTMPDLDALHEAAERAAALVHSTEPEPEPEPPVQTAPVQTPPAPAAEPEAARRGRKPSTAVQERTARVLASVQHSGEQGISRADIAAAMDEKPQQVYTSLQQLAQAGKVESRRLDDTGEYRWFAL